MMYHQPTPAIAHMIVTDFAKKEKNGPDKKIPKLLFSNIFFQLYHACKSIC